MQTLKYCINWDAVMLLHINGKFKLGICIHLIVVKFCYHYYMSRYEADMTVYSFLTIYFKFDGIDVFNIVTLQMLYLII